MQIFTPINPATGTISGAPTAGGTYHPRVTVTDSSSTAESYSVDFAIHTPWPPIAGSEAQLPDGTVGVPYPGVTFSATGGDGGSYSWLQDVGNQPPGLSISSSGVFSGTPTAAGTFIVSVSIYDTSGDEGTVAANW